MWDDVIPHIVTESIFFFATYILAKTVRHFCIISLWAKSYFLIQAKINGRFARIGLSEFLKLRSEFIFEQKIKVMHLNLMLL